MDHVHVVYATKTQHSKKLAVAIGKELGVPAMPVNELTQPAKTDLLYIVGGIYAGKCNPLLVSYAHKLVPSLVKKAILVTSSVSISHRSQKEIRSILTSNGIEVIDEIVCPGALLFIKLAHPNKRDIQSIGRAAKNIAAGAGIA